jgi:hypothetical protein
MDRKRRDFDGRNMSANGPRAAAQTERRCNEDG